MFFCITLFSYVRCFKNAFKPLVTSVSKLRQRQEVSTQLRRGLSSKLFALNIKISVKEKKKKQKKKTKKTTTKKQQQQQKKKTVSSYVENISRVSSPLNSP